MKIQAKEFPQNILAADAEAHAATDSYSVICVPVEMMELISRVRAISDDQILRLPEVRERTGRAASTIWKDIHLKVFPSQVSLGPRSVGWKKSEISAWIEARAFASRTNQTVDMRAFIELLTAPQVQGGMK